MELKKLVLDPDHMLKTGLSAYHFLCQILNVKMD